MSASPSFQMVRQIKYSPAEAPAVTKPPKSALRKHTTLREPSYGCLKNGSKPTFRNTTQRAVNEVDQPETEKQSLPRAEKKTMRHHYSSFGKNKHNRSIRVLIKDQKTVNAVEREKKKLDKHPLSVVCDYLAKRNLYQAGSDAPEDILRETYKNAHLAGNVYNNNDAIMMHNFLKGSAGGSNSAM